MAEHTCPHTPETLKHLQELSLVAKVGESRMRIAEWVQHYGQDKVYVAFSGGKDSTVLLDIVRRDYPDIPAVFSNTGQEFPEIVQFVRRIPNVTWVRPAIDVRTVWRDYGFPVPRKKQASMICRLREYPETESNQNTRNLYLTGINSKGKRIQGFKIAERWKKLITAPFKVSDKCCDALKKEPMDRYRRETGRIGAITGEMASDSQMRRAVYLRQGCNGFDSKVPKSMPLAFWSDTDIWSYIQLRQLPYCEIYDMGYERTGCAMCAFGAHLDKGEGRFQRLLRTHPRLHAHCMHRLGLKPVLEYCGIPTGFETLEREARIKRVLDLFEIPQENR